MVDRISSEHPSITTVRATLARHGGTGRPRIDVPASDADDFPIGEVVRLVLDGTTYHARIDGRFDGDGRRIAGAYDSPRLARSPGEGPNRLVRWVEGADVRLGRSVLVDVIEPGFAYGVRPPGSETVYDAVEPPKGSLASIARSLEPEPDGE